MARRLKRTLKRDEAPLKQPYGVERARPNPWRDFRPAYERPALTNLKYRVPQRYSDGGTSDSKLGVSDAGIRGPKRPPSKVRPVPPTEYKWSKGRA